MHITHLALCVNLSGACSLGYTGVVGNALEQLMAVLRIPPTLGVSAEGFRPEGGRGKGTRLPVVGGEENVPSLCWYHDTLLISQFYYL